MVNLGSVENIGREAGEREDRNGRAQEEGRQNCSRGVDW